MSYMITQVSFIIFPLKFIYSPMAFPPKYFVLTLSIDEVSPLSYQVWMFLCYKLPSVSYAPFPICLNPPPKKKTTKKKKHKRPKTKQNKNQQKIYKYKK